MVKFFLTGDNHFGMKHDRYPEAKEKLIECRFESLRKMVEKANTENCNYFVVSGDLFDSTQRITTADVGRVMDILSSFEGTVLIIPGNHDYYTGNEKVWKDAEKAVEKHSNIIILKEFRKYSFGSGEDAINVYPAFCQSKHSKENNLGWIRGEEVDENEINIGIAHGAIKGIAPDMKEEYFLMTEKELKAIPMDAWFIGHVHIPYPGNLKEDEDIEGYRIFNAGTHEQTDLHNNTEGNGFIITVDKEDGKACVKARRFVSGQIRFYDLSVNVKPGSEDALKKALEEKVNSLPDSSVIRVTVTGQAKPEEYGKKETVCQEMFSRFLAWEKDDSSFSEEITVEKIRAEYAESSMAAKLLEELTDDPVALQMAYGLLNECRDR